MENNFENLDRLIEQSCKQFSEKSCLGFAFAEKLTYRQVYEQIKCVAASLRKFGVERGDRIPILADNAPSWGVAYFAIIKASAVAVPILPDFSEADILHILHDAGVRIAFTNARQLEKMYEAMDELELVVCFDRIDFPGPDKIAKFEDILLEPWPADFSDQKVSPEQTVSIIYTSGTSGHSKAVMLSHANLCASVKSASQLISIEPDWVFLSVLPLSHAYEFTVGFLLPLISGATIIYSRRRPTPTVLGEICKKERPSVICLVPMVVEKIYKKRVLPTTMKTFAQVLLSVPGGKRLFFKVIGRRLRDYFGGRLQVLAIGGAALNPEAEAFLRKSGLPYIAGYGLTESSPLLAAGRLSDKSVEVGSVGKPVPGVEIRICRPDQVTGIGEILARGANIMTGYYNDQELTDAAIDHEGWLKTGDLGHFDEHGNLCIKGRLKSVIVLSSGENIYPEGVEDKINGLPMVAESLLVEDCGKLKAIIYPDYEMIDQQTAKFNRKQVADFIDKLLKNIQITVNDQLPAYSKIYLVTERSDPFIKTATHKIKRYLYAN